MGASGSKAGAGDVRKRRVNARTERVDKISEAQLHEFRDAFNQFDKDKSGAIDKGELRLLCEWVGQDASDEDVEEMMNLGALPVLDGVAAASAACDALQPHATACGCLRQLLRPLLRPHLLLPVLSHLHAENLHLYLQREVVHARNVLAADR